jgi:hypothetical protein
MQTQDFGQAKTYCVKSLTQSLCPLFFAVLTQLFEVGRATVHQQSPWRTFQESLRDIPNWNQKIINEQTERALAECPHLERLVVTAMMCQASQLASVRNADIEAKDLPRIKAARFIHDSYVRVAQELVHNPMLFGQNAVDLSIQNREKVIATIGSCMEQTLDSYVPLEVILSKPMRKLPARTNRPSFPKPSTHQSPAGRPKRYLGAYDSDTFDSAQEPSVLIDNDEGAEPMEASSVGATAAPLVVDVPSPAVKPNVVSALAPTHTALPIAAVPEQSFIYAPSTMGKPITYQQVKQQLSQIIV